MSDSSQPAPNGPPVIQYATPVQFLYCARREGNLLVVPRGGQLPMRCVKCNAAALPHFTWRKKIFWHSALLYLILFPGLCVIHLLAVLAYIIVVLAVQRSIRIEAGLCEFHGRRYRARVRIGIGLGLLSAGLLVASIYFGNAAQYRWSNLGIYFGMGAGAVFLGLLFWVVFAVRILWAAKIDKYSAWLKGAGPEFLASLGAGEESWPGQ
jgi:hypothetical protein